MLDPTMRPNDSYEVRIVASDGNNIVELPFTYGISGAFKAAQGTTPERKITLARGDRKKAAQAAEQA